MTTKGFPSYTGVDNYDAARFTWARWWDDPRNFDVAEGYRQVEQSLAGQGVPAEVAPYVAERALSAFTGDSPLFGIVATLRQARSQ